MSNPAPIEPTKSSLSDSAADVSVSSIQTGFLQGMVILPIGDLGPLGLSYAADFLEQAADAHPQDSMLEETLQLAVDFLRAAAAQVMQSSGARW